MVAEPWARRLSGVDAGDVEAAVRSLGELVEALDGEGRPPELEAVRTVLATHLLAVRAVQDANGTDEAVVRLLRRAARDVLELLDGAALTTTG